MKHLFLKAMYRTICNDLAGFITELRLMRHFSVLTEDQELAADVLYFQVPRMHEFRNVVKACMLLDNILDDDGIADEVDAWMQNAPRIQHWSFLKTMATVLIAWVKLFYEERRVAC